MTSGAQVVRVIDGDTFGMASGERVQISSIDEPEMTPRVQCAAESNLATAARVLSQA